MPSTGSGAECLMPSRWCCFGKVVGTSSKKVGHCEKAFEGCIPSLHAPLSCFLTIIDRHFHRFLLLECSVSPWSQNQCTTYRQILQPWTKNNTLKKIFTYWFSVLFHLPLLPAPRITILLSLHYVWVSLSNVSWVIIPWSLEFTASIFWFLFLLFLFSSLISSRLMTHTWWVFLKSWNIYLFTTKL